MENEAKSGIHPLVAAASVAVIVLAGVGVAAFTGVLPGTSGKNKSDALPDAPKVDAKVTPSSAAEPKPVPAKVTAHTRPQRVAAAPQVAPAPPPAPVIAPKCLECGVVEAVQEVEVKGEGTGAGAVAGGVAGAVIGNQVGSKKNRTATRIIGAVGGAVLGNAVEKNVRTTKRYDITVRMEDGTLRTLSQPQAPTWRPGDKVRVVNDALQAG
jgi:outer membrane lipoprotein SlyB